MTYEVASPQAVRHGRMIIAIIGYETLPPLARMFVCAGHPVPVIQDGKPTRLVIVAPNMGATQMEIDHMLKTDWRNVAVRHNLRIQVTSEASHTLHSLINPGQKTETDIQVDIFTKDQFEGLASADAWWGILSRYFDGVALWDLPLEDIFKRGVRPNGGTDSGVSQVAVTRESGWTKVFNLIQ